MNEAYKNRVKEFFLLNRKFWKIHKPQNSKVLIEGFCDIPNYLINACVLGNKIAKVRNAEPVMLLKKCDHSSCEEEIIFNSFGIFEKIELDKYKFKIIILIRALFSTTKLYMQCFSLKRFLRYSEKGVKVGDLFYDTFIRYGNRYRYFSIYNPKFVFFVINYFCIFLVYQKLFDEKHVKSVVISHRVYLYGGLLARFALKYDAEVFVVRLTSIRRYTGSDNIYQNEFKPSSNLIKRIIDKKLYKNVDRYLLDRFKGEIEQHDVINAFKGKENVNSETFLKLHSIKNNKPIAVIFSHAFSDSPHCNEVMLFNDYYEWFKKTLKYINTVKDINWLVKPHPSSSYYGEEGEVKKLLKKYKNIKMVKSSLSTQSVLLVADHIVTVSGTVGLEFACLSKKPILAGDSVYSKQGITIEPQSIKNYFNTLSNLKKAVNLKPDELIRAKSILYWYHIGSFPVSQLVSRITATPSTNINEVLKQKHDQIAEANTKLKNNYIYDEEYYNSQESFIKSNSEYYTNIF